MPSMCIVFGCRTGYRLRAAEKSEGKLPPKLAFHRFPTKHPELFAKWKAALSFMDLSSTTNWERAGVCQRHFRDEDYMTADITNKGNPRKRMRLKPDAVPRVFDTTDFPAGCLPKVSEPRETKLATASARREHKMAIAEALEKNMPFILQVTGLQDLSAKLQEYKLPGNYHLVMYKENDNDIMCFQQVDLVGGQPQVITSLVIQPDLTFKAYKEGKPVNKENFTNVVTRLRTHHLPLITKVDEVPNILAILAEVEYNEQAKLDIITADLDNLNMDNLNEVQQQVINLFREQLKLAKVEVLGRRYTTKFLVQCVQWSMMAPKLYKTLVKTSGLILPSFERLRRFTTFTKFRGGIDPVTIEYFKMRFAKLAPRERVVHLAIDEVYTTTTLSLVGGSFFGEKEGTLTKTLLCAHVNSIAGSYQDMIAMEPIKNASVENMKILFNTCHDILTDINFDVHSLTLDNHRVNQSFIRHMGGEEFPVTIPRRVFVYYDPVHISKNMYYMLLNKTIIMLPWLPTLKEERKHNQVVTANMSHLRQLFAKDQGAIRSGHKLTHKVISPSNLERQSVGLMAAAVNSSTVAALRFYAKQEDLPDWNDTALFLEFVSNWFTILNVRRPGQDKRYRDTRKAVWKLEDEVTQRHVQFLQDTAELMQVWPSCGYPSNRMFTTDTRKAVYLTSTNARMAIMDALDRYKDQGIDHICPGKMTSDKEEHAFGRRRNMSGTNYWTEAKQFFQAETVIRTISLVKLSGYTLQDVKEHMAPLHEDQVASDEKMAKEFIEELDIDSERLDPGEMEPGEAGGVGHFCGYLARKARRHLKCASCQDALIEGNTLMPAVQVTDFDKLPETFRKMINLQDRGGLLYPSNECIHMAMMAVEVFKAMTAPGEWRAKFLAAYSSEEVFVKVYREIMNNDLGMSLLNCENGCSLVISIVPAIARSLFHVMAKNMMSKANSAVHGKIKRSDTYGSEKATRSKSDYKRQKFSSEKKRSYV